MAMPAPNAAGVSQLTQQLRSADAATERAMSMVEEMRSAINDMHEQIESTLQGLQADVGELRDECDNGGSDATTAVEGFGEANQVGAEDRVPSASESLTQALSASESSFEASADQLEDLGESLGRDGFDELSSTLTDVQQEDEASSTALSAALTELVSVLGAAQETLTAGASETTRGFDDAIADLEGEPLQSLEAETQDKAALLQSEAASSDQGATEIATRMQEGYAGWKAGAEGARDSMLERVVAAVEETMQSLLAAQQDCLQAPCEQLLHEAVPTAQSELEGVAGESANWDGGAQELSSTAGELGQAKDAKDSFDRTVG